MSKKSVYIIIFALLALIAIVIGHEIFQDKGRVRGIAGLEPPVQTELGKDDPTGTDLEIGGWDVRINYKYAYDINALVLHTKDYNGIKLADRLSPRDLGLGWGASAQFNDMVDFQWDQSGRWIQWSLDSYEELAVVGGEAAVNSSCSNNHVIPADKNVKTLLKRIKMGDHVELKGYLVDVSATKANGAYFDWNSSTSRDDTGNGACEVFYVTSVKWLD